MPEKTAQVMFAARLLPSIPHHNKLVVSLCWKGFAQQRKNESKWEREKERENGHNFRGKLG